MGHLGGPRDGALNGAAALGERRLARQSCVFLSPLVDVALVFDEGVGVILERKSIPIAIFSPHIS